MNLIEELTKKELIRPPSWLPNSVQYLCVMGSTAYGVGNNDSDTDVYGFCIPPKHIIFPHLSGIIPGFGNQGERFDQWSEHHVMDKQTAKEYDFAIYNIVKYFSLVMENNPNMIDSLFVPEYCIMHQTKVGIHVRDNRKLFLHKGCWHKFRGYAHAQAAKMSSKEFKNEKRKADVEEFGYSTKFAMHLVRLLCEVEQLLIEGNLDLQRDKELLKTIRRGEWTEEQIREWMANKEKDLEKAYAESKLPHSPDEAKLKKLLFECLEEHYGRLDDSISMPDRFEVAIREIQKIIGKI